MVESEVFERLPKHTTPVNYKLKLQPNLKDFTFSGQVAVILNVNEETSQIKMNSADLVISEAVLVHSTQGDVSVKECKYNVKEETYIIDFQQPLKPGSANLSMKFTGELNDKMKGFYRSKYVVDGVEKYNAVTQFESTDARRCFPCWDEPALKATYDVTLVVPKDLVALSNMSSTSERATDGGLKTIEYATTPIMSTYLLAFVVGEFDFVEGVSNHGVNIKVYSPPGKSQRGNHALNVGIKALDFFTEYFDIPYPLDKLDLIAIADFASGAMENWGLVTYREPALLIDEESSSESQKQYVAIVVSHELAHQWFGNLVTMEWWTHLWLNEGFASFMEYMATDSVHPHYKVWQQFVNDDLIVALDLDSLDNSHPIEIPVGHPEEVDEIFDIISYQKGSSIIRMLFHWIGPKAFQTGLRSYLKEFSYKNTQTEDLWRAFEASSGQPVEKVMSTWTQQMGFPVLNVSMTSQTENSVTLQITQEKYNQSESDKTNYLWMVPISVSTCNGKTHQNFLLDSKTNTITVNGVDKNGWVKLNPGFTGFYRVNYSDDMMQLLMKAVKNNELDCLDRLNIVNDAYAMASSGVTSFVDYLKVVSSYANEQEYPVWKEISSKLTQVKYFLWNDDVASDLLVKFKNNLFENIADRLGIESSPNESHFDKLLRSVALANCNTESVEKKCVDKFNAFYNDGKPLSPDIRSVVYSKYVGQGGQLAFETMKKMNKSADTQEEENRIHGSMGAIKEMKVFLQALDYMMGDEVRDCDRIFMLRPMACVSRQGRDECWKFVQNKWDVLYNKFKNNYMLGRLIKYATENFATEEMLKNVQEFLKDRITKNSDRAYKQSIEKIQQKIKYWDVHGEKVKSYLVENFSG